MNLIFILFSYTVSGQFTEAPALSICDYQNATSASPVSNYCKGLSSGTTMNLYLSGSLASRNGYLSFLPTATGTSAYLRFGGRSCYDARGMSELVLEIQVSAPVTLKLDFGTSSDCVNKQASEYTAATLVSSSTGFQTIRFPINFFANMNLQKLLTIGIGSVSPLNVEIRILKIYFSRKQFVTRARHELFEWTSNGRRVPFRFSSFNAPDISGRSDMGQDGFLDPYEQEDLIISAKQLGGRVIRTYCLRVRSPTDVSGRVGLSKAIQGIGIWGETQLVAFDRTLMYANRHGVRVIIPLIDNWEYFGGVQSFSAYRSKPRDSFFTDPVLIDDFRKVISMFLNRKNTITGIIYKNDPAILAWQLGNELCVGELQNGSAPNYRLMPPASWANTMANYIRTIDNNHLIIDGYWSNGANYGNMWDTELSNIRYIDILCAHYYGGESASALDTVYSSRMDGNAVNAVNVGKAVMIDEFGIARRSILKGVQDVISKSGNRITGVLLWSIRSQSVRGGALVHNEYAGFQSYQWPGYTKGPRCNAWFRIDNYDVLNDMRKASANISQENGLSTPLIYPPCSHNGAILEATIQSLNSQSLACVWSYTHAISGVSVNYRAVNLRIRQPTGAFSNMVQFSFDNVKFVNLDYADMTVSEGNFLYAHKVPVLISGGTGRDIYYRISGLLISFQNTWPTASLKVFVSGVDNAFFNWWLVQSAGVLNTSAAPKC